MQCLSAGWLNKHLLLTVLEEGEVQDQGFGWFYSCLEFSSWSADGHHLHVPSHGRERLSPSLSLLTRALVSFMRAPPSWPNYLQRSYLQNITLGIRVLTYKWGGGWWTEFIRLTTERTQTLQKEFRKITKQGTKQTTTSNNNKWGVDLISTAAM